MRESEGESEEGVERLICMLVTVCRLFDLEGVLNAGWWDAAEWERQNKKKKKNKVPARVCVRGRQRGECVIRCEVLGAALCSLKGSGCCPALCSSSTVLHVSHPPFLLSSSVLPFPSFLPPSLISSSPLWRAALPAQRYRNKTPLCKRWS